MDYLFEIKIINCENDESEDFKADDHDEAIGILAAHYAKALKEMEATASIMIDEMADEGELLEEIKK